MISKSSTESPASKARSAILNPRDHIEVAATPPGTTNDPPGTDNKPPGFAEFDLVLL